jgi:protein O-GlcNAc transferase
LKEGQTNGQTRERLLEVATACHRAGNLAEARRLYTEILILEPAHTLALFRSGLLELQDGRPAEALALISRAAAAAPGETRYQLGMGQVLQSLGRWDEAATAYRSVLHLDPDSADAHFALGVALQSQAQHEAAIAAFERAIALREEFPEAFNNLGMSRQLTGQFAQAAAAYSAALALRPGDAMSLGNKGAVLREMGDLDQAVLLLRAAMGLEPRNAAHSINLAIALCQRRDFADAEAILRKTIALEPNNAEAAFNLGNALDGLGRPQEAIGQYRHAVALHPGYAGAWNNLGNVYKQCGDFAEAMTAFSAAISARPDYVVALNNLGCLLRTLGRNEEAERVLRQGLEVDGHHAALYDNLGNVLKDAGELDEAIDCFRKALDIDPGNAATHSNLAYTLSFQSLEPAPILDQCVRWNARFAAPLFSSRDGHPRQAATDRRLKIGYVSADFRDHCQSLFTMPLLSHHDHSRFEIFCYSSVERPDDHTRRIANHADVWRDVRSSSDAELYEVIRGDGVDILVDLTMHMAYNRLLVFARKPAPVQIAWLAYPGTTGVAAMDYRLSDPRLDPEGFDDHYSERTLRLADSFWCYDPLTDEPKVSALPAIERGYLTLGCLNNPCKLTDRTLQLWGGVMRAIPDARLLLMAPPGRHRQRLLARLGAQDIAARRVDFLGFRPRADYLNSYHDIDLGLDSFPYNGHTTSLDALWMGVPIVSRVGKTSVGRGGLSQLFHLDLLELAAETDAAFVEKAVALGTDLPRLAALRRELRGRLERSPLMDAERFARNIEAAYAQAWTSHCNGR